MSDAADEIAEMAEEIAARKNSGPSDHTQTDAGQAGFASPRTRPRLRLSTGESGPFFRTKGKMYGAERTYYIKVENVDDEKHVTEVKLVVSSIDPQNEYIGP